MAKFKIEFIERKTTSTGKEMAKLNLITEEGELLQGVSIWADYPGFKDFKTDDYIEGDYKDTGQWKNLYPPKPATAQGGGAMRGVAAAQERKAVAIEKTMDRKEAGITVAAAMRDCTLIVLASLRDTPFPDHNDFVSQFKDIKSWYLKEWSDTEKLLDQPF